MTVAWTIGLRTCDGAILLSQRTKLSPLAEIVYTEAVESDKDAHVKYRKIVWHYEEDRTSRKPIA